MTFRKQEVSIFVHRSTHNWVVRDPEGNLWMMPAIEGAWEHRQQFKLTDESELERVPGHYRYLLELPFEKH